jgi:hypothetical protein
MRRLLRRRSRATIDYVHSLHHRQRLLIPPSVPCKNHLLRNHTYDGAQMRAWDKRRMMAPQKGRSKRLDMLASYCYSSRYAPLGVYR